MLSEVGCQYVVEPGKGKIEEKITASNTLVIEKVSTGAMLVYGGDVS